MTYRPTYAEARDAARDMVRLTDVPVFLMADTRGPDEAGAVLVRRQDDRREAWIPGFMCEIGPGDLVPGHVPHGWGPHTLTAAYKVLQWKGLD